MGRLWHIPQLRQPEVEDLHAVAGQHHHVARFQVAVNDAVTMRRNYGIDDLRRQVKKAVERQAATGNTVGKRAAVQMLHRHE